MKGDLKGKVIQQFRKLTAIQAQTKVVPGMEYEQAKAINDMKKQHCLKFLKI